MQIEQKDILELIGSILKPGNNQQRLECQKMLESFKEKCPSDLIYHLMSIVAGQFDKAYIEFALTQLKRCLTGFHHSTNSLWKNLTQQIKQLFKQQFFNIILFNPNIVLKKKIADFFAEIACSIMRDYSQQWPQFKPCLWQILQNKNKDNVIVGFKIVQVIYQFLPNFFKDNTNTLQVAFKAFIPDSNSRVKLAALEAFKNHLTQLDSKCKKLYTKFIPQIFSSLTSLCQHQFNQQAIKIFQKMIKVNSQFFFPFFNQLFIFLQKTFSLQTSDIDTKGRIIQVFIYFVGEKAIQLKKYDIKNNIENLIQMIFMYSTQIQQKITQQWKSPTEEYLNEQQNIEQTKIGVQRLKKLIKALGVEYVFLILIPIIHNLFVFCTEDWRYKYLGLQASSIIHQFMQCQQFVPFIENIQKYLQHKNCKLRYAACVAISQCLLHRKQQFLQQFGERLFTKLIPLLNDNIPRVTLQATSTLNCMMQVTYNQQKFFPKEQFHKMLNALFYNLHINIPTIKVMSLTCITSSSIKNKFLPYTKQVIQLLLKIFEQIQISIQSPILSVQKQALQCLTTIAKNVGKQIFEPYFKDLISIMLYIQQIQIKQNYGFGQILLQGWQKICFTFGQSLGILLQKIIPQIFIFIQKIINQQIQIFQNNNNQQNNNNILLQQNQQQYKQKITKQITKIIITNDQYLLTIKMLKIFIIQLNQLMQPYLQKSIQLIIKILNLSDSRQVIKQIYKCLYKLIIYSLKYNIQNGIKLGKYFIIVILQKCQEQYDLQLKSLNIYNINKIIKLLPQNCYNQQQLYIFGQKIMELLMDLLIQKQNNQTQINKIQKKQINLQFYFNIGTFKQQIIEIEQVISRYMDFFQTLFKKYGEKLKKLADFIIQDVLIQLFNQSVEKQQNNCNDTDDEEPVYINGKMFQIKIGLFFIDYFVEYMSFDQMQNYWSSFQQVLLKYSLEKNVPVRQAACYGVGIYAQKTPLIFIANSSTVQNWLQILINCHKISSSQLKLMSKHNAKKISSMIPYCKQSFQNSKCCSDNAISAIGKILFIYHDKIQNSTKYIDYWLFNLPLQSDKQQSAIQNQIFLQFVENHFDKLLQINVNYDKNKISKFYKIFNAIISNIQKLIDQQQQNPVKNQLIINKVKICLAKVQQVSNYLKQNFDFSGQQVMEENKKL